MLTLDDFLQRQSTLTGLFGSVNDRKIKAKAPRSPNQCARTEFRRNRMPSCAHLPMPSRRGEERRDAERFLPEAFATVRGRQAHAGSAPFRRSAIGGMVLHEGRISETDRRGKTLVATFRFNALVSKACTSSRSTTISPSAT
jgi:preprotein translocase subunit SecA